MLFDSDSYEYSYLKKENKDYLNFDMIREKCWDYQCEIDIDVNPNLLGLSNFDIPFKDELQEKLIQFTVERL